MIRTQVAYLACRALRRDRDHLSPDCYLPRPRLGAVLRLLAHAPNSWGVPILRSATFFPPGTRQLGVQIFADRVRQEGRAAVSELVRVVGNARVLGFRVLEFHAIAHDAGFTRIDVWVCG